MKKNIFIIMSFILFFNVCFISQEIFVETKNFDVGKRAFHINSYKNYTIVADYNGTVHFIDHYTLEKETYENYKVPMGGAFNGAYKFIIDNKKQLIAKIKEGEMVKKKSFYSKPVNMRIWNNYIYITATNPNQVYILDYNLNLIDNIKLPVKSPLLEIANNKLFIPIFNNYEDNFKTDLLLLNPEEGTFVLNEKNIQFPIDLCYKNGKYYLINYFQGNLYEGLKTQNYIESFGKYSTNIETFREYLVINSFSSGLHFFDPQTKRKKTILEEYPIKDFTISNDNKYIYAISHIYNKLFIIKDFEIYKELDTFNFPIDVDTPDENLITILSTDSGKLQIIRRFE